MLFLLLFTWALNVSSYSNNGYVIKDLHQGSSFVSDVGAWDIQDKPGGASGYTDCAGKQLLGGKASLGYSKYAQRTYSGLKTHSMAFVKITVWRIDSYDPNDHLYLEVDGNSWKIDGMNIGAQLPSNICQMSNWGDFGPLDIIVSLPHTNNNIEIKFISNLDEDNEESGISDITILVTKGPVLPMSIKAHGIVVPSSMTNLDCPIGQYKNSGGTCSNCDSTCFACTGAGLQGCSMCGGGAFFDSGSSECKTCNAGCEACNQSQCLACANSDDFMYFNQSCISSCDQPYTQVSGASKQCNFKCTSTQFLDWEDKCQTACPQFHNEVILGPQAKQCLYPCQTTEYLDWEGKCQTRCEQDHFTKRVERNRNYCDYPCNGTDSLHQDGTCGVCKYPLIEVINRGVKFCQQPCQEKEYYFMNNSCHASCPVTFQTEVINNVTSCTCPKHREYANGKNDCRCPDEYEDVPGSNKCQSVYAQQPVFKVADVAAIGTLSMSAPAMLSGVDPTLMWGLINLMQMFFYLSFLNIEYPENFKQFLQIFKLGRLQFLPDMFGIFYNEEDVDKSYSLPKFQENDYTTLFVSTAAEMLFMVSGAIGLGILSYLIAKLPFGQYINSLGKKGIKIFFWNGIIGNWLAVYNEMNFASTLQITSLNFETKGKGFSSVLAIFFFILFLFTPILIYTILRKVDTKKSNVDQFSVLFGDFKPEKYNSKNHLSKVNKFQIVLSLKDMFSVIGIIAFYHMPIIQNGVALLLTLTLSIAYIKKKPFQRTVLNFKQLFISVGFLIIHAFIMILIIRKDDPDTALKNQIGWILIGIVTILFMAELILMFKDTFNSFKGHIKLIKVFIVKLFQKRAKKNVKITPPGAQNVDTPTSIPKKRRKSKFKLKKVLEGPLPQMNTPKQESLKEIEKQHHQKERRFINRKVQKQRKKQNKFMKQILSDQEQNSSEKQIVDNSPQQQQFLKQETPANSLIIDDNYEYWSPPVANKNKEIKQQHNNGNSFLIKQEMAIQRDRKRTWMNKIDLLSRDHKDYQVFDLEMNKEKRKKSQKKNVNIILDI